METKNTQYAEWTSLVLKLNKEVVMKSKAAEKNIVQKYNAIQIDIENKRRQNHDYINACQNEIQEMMSKVNNFLISNKIQIQSYSENSVIYQDDILWLNSEIQSSMQQIREIGSSILMKTPSKVSGGLGCLLFCIWIIPGIIYFMYTQNKVDTERRTYENLCKVAFRTYALIDKYKSVVELMTQQSAAPLLSQRVSEIETTQSEVKRQGDAILSKLYEYPCKNNYSGLEWSSHEWSRWTPSSATIPNMIRIGDFQASDSTSEIRFSSFIPFQQGSGLYYKSSSEHHQSAMRSAKSVMLRLLLTTQPGKLEFTLIDPVQLGGSVNEFLSLTDIDPDLINKQVCSSTEQITNRLAIITEQIKTIQQVYLKTDFDCIEVYNESVKTIAEPYRIVFINDFPINFSSDSIRNLISIATNGPKCGIYPIIIAPVPYQHYDTKLFSDIENNCLLVSMVDSRIHIDDPRFDLFTLSLEESPSFSQYPYFKAALMNVAEMSLLNKKVEYSYTDMLSRAGLERDRWWKSSANECLEAPIGPSGAKRILNLRLDSGMTPNALCVGRPGSGKSNLMSVIITSLALKYKPEELQLFLIDLKSGVTFKQFARYGLPHAKVIAIDSDRGFSLAVLKGLEGEMEQRGIAFRNTDTRSLAAYREKTGKLLPRVLMIIDEFQDLFIDMDGVNKDSTRILERLIREGRQFGIHVFLGTQSLSGISIPKAILDLVAVRIALQCSDAESRVVLSENNSAANLLKKPGEAIYNAFGGVSDSNERFQVAYYKDEDESYLSVVRNEYDGKKAVYETLVFDGSEPSKISDLSIAKNILSGIAFKNTNPCVWVGRPVSTQEYSSIEFRRGPGNHLSIVDSNHKQGVGVMVSSLLSLYISQSKMKPIIYYISYDDEESEQNLLLPVFVDLFGESFKQIKRRGLSGILETLRAVADSDNMSERPPTFLFLDAIHKSRDFEAEDYGDDSEEKIRRDSLRHLIRYGADNGIHVIIRSESFERYIEIVGKFAAEIKYRIAGIMDFNSSMQYVMDQHASRIEKSNRMILYRSDVADNQEKYQFFIPYEFPNEIFINNLLLSAKTIKES